MSQHPYERVRLRTQLSKRFRQDNWDHHVGQSKGECLCFTGCGAVISQMTFECGHIVAASRGGEDTHDNIVPVCSMCNRSMGAKHMRDYCKRNGYIMTAAIADPPTPPANPPPTPILRAVDTREPQRGIIAPATFILATRRAFNPRTFDIAAQLKKYAWMSVLDDTLGAYAAELKHRFQRTKTPGGSAFNCDRRFVNGLFDDLLRDHFGIQVIIVDIVRCIASDDWGTVGSGERFAAVLLSYIREYVSTAIPDNLAQLHIDSLDRDLINVLIAAMARMGARKT
jgi:hypothetical protein